MDGNDDKSCNSVTPTFSILYIDSASKTVVEATDLFLTGSKNWPMVINKITLAKQNRPR